MLPRMASPQAGIFALGTSSHTYLELDRTDGIGDAELVHAVSELDEPRTTIGGVNLVVGFRPELFRNVLPDAISSDVHGFDRDMLGTEGYVLPATQHDVMVWISGAAYDVLFDTAHDLLKALRPRATLAHEVVSWPYRHTRDLTGFIDGSENPPLVEAQEFAVVGAGAPGEGGSVLLLQQWVHDHASWAALPVERQEAAIGRRKADSEELPDKPENSHVARTDQDTFGKIFRRNMPYGSVPDNGTMFVGFSAAQERLQAMLESMAGIRDGIRDALTYHTKPLTGAYYWVPPVDALRRA